MDEVVQKYGNIPGSPWCDKAEWPECDPGLLGDDWWDDFDKRWKERNNK